MTVHIHPKALAAREETVKTAVAMGIDERFIDILVEAFYGRIRQDPDLGPMFDNVIGTDWSKHLPKMKDFWASIAMAAGRYRGKPMEAHKRLDGVTPEHFHIWLRLFRETLNDIAPTPEARNFFVSRAERIAESLQLGMFYSPAIREGTQHD